MFDPEVSASQILADRMGSPVVSFTLRDIRTDYAQGAWFVPQRTDLTTLNPIQGLLARIEEDYCKIFPVQYYTNTQTFVDFSSSQHSISNQFGDYPFIRAEPYGNDYFLMIANKTINQWYFTSSSYTESNISGNEKVLGVGNVANLTTRDRLSYCFLYEGAIAFFTNSSYDYDMPGFSPPTVNDDYLAFPDIGYIKTPGALFDTGTYYYLSCSMADGTKAIYRWDYATEWWNINPLRYPAAYGPLIAALSDGRLLAYDGAITTVLSVDMDKLFSFPSGTLRFAHERFNGVENICVFSRCTFVESKDEKGNLRIEIFEIPTAQLSRLGS